MEGIWSLQIQHLNWKFGKAFTETEIIVYFLRVKKTMGMKLFWVCFSAAVFLEFPENTSLEEHTALATPKYLRMPSANAVDNLTRRLDLCGSEKAQVHSQDSLAFLTLQFDEFSPSFFFTFKLYFCSSPLS